MLLTRSPARGLVVVAAVLAGGRPVVQHGERANSAIIRLEPSAFELLAPAVRAELERQGCLVPQTYLGGPPHNVIRGRFTAAGQMDRRARRDRLLTSLSVATPQYIRRQHERYGGPTLPALDHDGIDDGVSGEGLRRLVLASREMVRSSAR